MHRASRLNLLDLLIVAALFVLPLAFFWQVTLGDKTLLPADNLYQFQPWAAYRDQLGVPFVPHNSLLSDLVLENLPWKQFVRESLANRDIPLWNPYIFAGVPFLAAGQHSAMYPFSLIYYVMPLEKAYGWFTVSQLWLAGLFMYLFMRGLGVGRLGGMVAAVAFQMSGFFIASVVFQMIIAAAAWFPFLLLMVEFTIRQRPLFGRPAVIPWIALGAVGLGMEILAGHVEFTYYALLVMAFWAACRLGIIAWHHWRSRDLRAIWQPGLLKPAFSLVALVVLGLAVGAIQFIPTLELAGYNFREGSASFAEVRGYAYPPRHALAFLMPNFYGSPAQHNYLDVFTGQQTAINWKRTDNATVTDTYWEVNKNYVEGACYVGLLTLFLAAVALFNARFEKAPHARIDTAGPYRAILAALALLSVTFVFGTITYAILYYGLPGINQLHSPFRWVFPLTLCLAALAGFGAEALQRARGESTFGVEYWRNGAATSFTFRLARVLGWALVWIGAGTLAGLVLSRVLFERLHGPIESLFHKLAGADMAFPTVEAFYSYEFRQILFIGLFVVACGIVIRVSRCPIYLPRRLGQRPVWELLALVVLALDLVVAWAGFNPAADPAWLKFEPPAITWLKQHDPQQWRFTAIEGPTHTMNANVGWLYGLQDIRGYDSMIPKQYVAYMNQIQPQNQLLYNRIAPIFPDHLEALDSPLLDLLSVKYVVSEIEIDTRAHPKYKQVYKDDAVRIYENQDVMPRAFVYDGWGTDEGSCTYMTQWQPSKDDSHVHEAQVSTIRGNEIVLNVTGTDFGPEGGMIGIWENCLFLSDSYFPGWRAYIRPQGTTDDQERELPISRKDTSFRVVSFPPGSWTVRFRYSPPSFQIGAFTTFIALAVIVFTLLAWGWRRFYNAEGAESHGARRLAKNSIAPIGLNFFNRAIDFAFAAIMMRVLGPADAGVYYYAIVIFGWFDTLTNFGLNLLLTREVARDRSAAGRYLLNSSALRLILAGIGVPLLILFFVVYGWLFKPVDPLATGAILLLYVGLVPNSISYGLTALFYAFEKAEVPAAVSTVSAILKAVFGLAALLIGWGVLGLAGASILINVITLIILGYQARGLLTLNSPSLRSDEGEVPPVRLDRALIREMVFVSWPLMLNNLLAGMFYKIDVTLLEPLSGNKVVGQYGSAYKWLDALGLIPSLFTMALLPIMSRQAHEDRAALQRNYHFAVKLLVMVALPTAVALTFIAYLLIGLLGGAQFLPEGAIALQLMVWFIPIGWINSLTNYVLVALDLQRPMRWAFLAGVGFNIIANLVFIPLFSFRAAAIITVLSEVVLQIGFYRLLRRTLAPVPWIGLLWKPVAAALVMAAVLVVLTPLGTIGLFAGLVIGAGLYAAVLLALRPFTPWEISQVAALVPGRVRRLAHLGVRA